MQDVPKEVEITEHDKVNVGTIGHVDHGSNEILPQDNPGTKSALQIDLEEEGLTEEDLDRMLPQLKMQLAEKQRRKIRSEATKKKITKADRAKKRKMQKNARKNNR